MFFGNISISSHFISFFLCQNVGLGALYHIPRKHSGVVILASEIFEVKVRVKTGHRVSYLATSTGPELIALYYTMA